MEIRQDYCRPCDKPLPQSILTCRWQESILFLTSFHGHFRCENSWALVVSIFSGTALLLAAVGLYGVLAYSVTRQTPEIGVRIAGGALRHHIVNLVLKQGFKMVGISRSGVLTASVLSQFLGSLLYGVSGNDPITIVPASIVVLSFAALLACLLPALRAIRVNPVTVLRE